MKENLESIGNINQLAGEEVTFAGFLKNDEFYRNLSEKMEGFGKGVEKFGMIVGVADVIRAKPGNRCLAQAQPSTRSPQMQVFVFIRCCRMAIRAGCAIAFKAIASAFCS